MDGILLVDKPRGWTSFDAVNKVRHIVQQSGLNRSTKKRFPVGHTGTLDPLATGLLVLLLGDYTKQAPELSKLDKTYQVTMRLGQTSTTGDEEGEKTKVSPQQPSKEQVLSVLKQFQGELEQTPPAYSAIKVNGQRAYKLARAGQPVKLEPRLIKIYSLTDVTYAYPKVTFAVRVSSGTYIRSLVEDIGRELSTGAYMSDLRRTSVGKFQLADAIPADKLDGEQIYQHLQ